MMGKVAVQPLLGKVTIQPQAEPAEIRYLKKSIEEKGKQCYNRERCVHLGGKE